MSTPEMKQELKEVRQENRDLREQLRMQAELVTELLDKLDELIRATGCYTLPQALIKLRRKK